MAKYSFAKHSLSPDCVRMLRELGERIRFARKRRAMSLADLAAGMLSSVGTAQRLERGDASVSLGALMSALMCLGLEKDMEKVAGMETDLLAFAHDRRRLLGKKRGRKATPEETFFEGL